MWWCNFSCSILIIPGGGGGRISHVTNSFHFYYIWLGSVLSFVFVVSVICCHHIIIIPEKWKNSHC